jgi:hypothetical protein
MMAAGMPMTVATIGAELTAGAGAAGVLAMATSLSFACWLPENRPRIDRTGSVDPAAGRTWRRRR